MSRPRHVWWPLAAALLLLPASGRLVATDEPMRRIAFGSCASQERPQPIWEAVVAGRPDLFLFLGDNIYADTQDMDVMRAKYAKLAAMPGYQKLRATCPVLATWDDHDYGANDAGAEYPRKAESQRLFLDFFGEPAGSPRRQRPGVYDARVFGPEGRRVQVILLDTRSFRSPLKRRPGAARGEGRYAPDSEPSATILGEDQWAWLQANGADACQGYLVSKPLPPDALFPLLQQGRWLSAASA
jgi:alkaline phosphatase D